MWFSFRLCDTVNNWIRDFLTVNNVRIVSSAIDVLDVDLAHEFVMKSLLKCLPGRNSLQGRQDWKQQSETQSRTAEATTTWTTRFVLRLDVLRQPILAPHSTYFYSVRRSLHRPKSKTAFFHCAQRISSIWRHRVLPAWASHVRLQSTAYYTRCDLKSICI